MAQDAAALWAEDNYHFYGQRAGEKVMLVRNQHGIVLLPVFLVTLVSLVIPFFLLRWPGTVTWGLTAAYGLIILYYFLYHLYGYRHSVNILTSERILNIEQRGFFHAKISEAELTRIQDVSSDIKGILQTTFGFGNVTIRTASETLLTLRSVPRPYDVQQAIVRALKAVKRDEPKKGQLA